MLFYSKFYKIAFMSEEYFSDRKIFNWSSFLLLLLCQMHGKNGTKVVIRYWSIKAHKQLTFKIRTWFDQRLLYVKYGFIKSLYLLPVQILLTVLWIALLDIDLVHLFPFFQLFKVNSTFKQYISVWKQIIRDRRAQQPKQHLLSVIWTSFSR